MPMHRAIGGLVDVDTQTRHRAGAQCPPAITGTYMHAQALQRYGDEPCETARGANDLRGTGGEAGRGLWAEH